MEPVTPVRTFALLAGPVLAVLLGLWVGSAASPAAGWTAGITLLCAVWWIFEPVPIPVTSLIPLAAFPMAGILTPAQVGDSYGNQLILLLLGGFILSRAMEQSGAHRRLALNMVGLFGGSGGRPLVFGFMLASAVLSMWISNTATTLMLLPIVLAVLEKSNDPLLRRALLLGVAYAASVGGIGTPIGTPPNLIFMEVYGETTGNQPTFLEWMAMGLPVVVILVPVLGLWLTRRLGRAESLELPEVGHWRPEEVRTLVVFGCTALAWMTLREPFGGWSQLLGVPAASNASVALLAVVVMFLVPNGRGGRLLTWDKAVTIPWGALILFGGGIAIAKAFVASGLSEILGNQMVVLQQFHPLVLTLLLCLSVTFLTEITSNTATTALLMPILAAAGTAAGIDPILLMVPAAMTASCAFMLPVATAPNAVVFSSNQVTIREMAREGFVLNLLGVTVVAVVCYFTL
ncbi:MAG: SLC13 family permease [Xanthomonadales bacterium]|nr:SLC13 family permease [Xanthomonadales bacterium]